MKKGWFYILITAAAFTTLEPVSKLISAQINPLSITFIRFFIGGVILLPFSARNMARKNLKPSGKVFLTLTLLGVLCICVSMVLLQYAVMIADSPALIAIIFSSNSVFTLLFAAWFLGDKFTPAKRAAIALCSAGVLLCADFSSGSNLLSVALAVLSALTFSLYTVLSKKYMTTLTGVIQTGFSFFIGSIVLLCVLLAAGIPPAGGLNADNLRHLLYLGVVVTGVGYWAYFKGMEQTSAMAASLVFFIKPILTPFAAFLINGIVPNGKVFAALVLVFA
ncbi:MAG: DMT family transporter, partial [Clostridiales bacterium]|nr:DMT family transporter [Clostridiales bacterium]